MLDSILKIIEKYGMLSQGDRVVVAVSGGPDSIALLHILHSIKERYGLYIHAVHLNHMLRGKEADEDTRYVEGFCERYNIPCTVKYVDINELSMQEGLSLEEAGRKARYELFRDTARRVGATKIALAHNMNDQAETVIMRIMRGTGLDGLAGIRPVREGLFIRPLLYTLRADIEKYCRDNKLDPRIDSTNLEPIYSRNKIRLELIPYIKANYSPGIERSLSTMAELLREDKDFIDTYVDLVYSHMAIKEKDRILIDIEDFKRLHIAIKKRIVRRAIEDIKGDLNGIESKHVDLILSAVDTGTTGAAVELPGHIKAKVSYKRLNIMNLSGKTNYEFCHSMLIPGVTVISETGAVIEAQIGCIIPEHFYDNNFVKYFDYDKIRDKLTVRTRKAGDFIVPIGMKGSKKLKELFIDDKIPREERSKIPLVSIGKEIVWVVGYKISDNYKITRETERILKLEYKQQGGNNNVE